MKAQKSNVILSGLIILTLIGCETKQRYTQNSPEIETVKAAFDNYLSGDWETYQTHYAADAKIHSNSTESKPSTIQEIIALQKMEIAPLSSYSIDKENQALEMVLEDEGETWVNYWGVWSGTLTATNQTFEIPIHITYQFIDGKIVEQHGYWNNTEITLATRALQAEEEAKAAAAAIPD